MLDCNGLHSLTDLMEMIHNFKASASYVWLMFYETLDESSDDVTSLPGKFSIKTYRIISLKLKD